MDEILGRWLRGEALLDIAERVGAAVPALREQVRDGLRELHEEAGKPLLGVWARGLPGGRQPHEVRRMLTGRAGPSVEEQVEAVRRVRAGGDAREVCEQMAIPCTMRRGIEGRARRWRGKESER